MATGIQDIADRLRQVRVSPRPELQVTRHLMGGQPQYVIFDPITLQSHRFSADDYQLLVAISDKLTLHEVFQKFVASGQLQPADEEQFLRFVLYLHQIALLNLPIADGTSLYRRYLRRRATSWIGRFMGMLFWRVPLVQPDRFLDRTYRWISPLFSRGALTCWCIAMSLSLYCVFAQWTQFTQPISGMFDYRHLPALWLLLVALKLCHEMGHAYACKAFGGSVPEIGAYIILLTPCAYVDASASWGFTSRWQRMTVALAGMYVESIIAMLALIVWCLRPEGWVGETAHAAIVLSTIVTLGFNANPLMRYDGYYILSDLLNRPNLRAESQRVFLGVFKRLLFGIAQPPSTESWSVYWFYFLFGALSMVYQQIVVIGICITLMSRVPLLGLLFGLLFGLISFGGLLTQYVLFLLRSAELQNSRRRAVLVTTLLVAGITLLSVVRLPCQFSSEGTLIRSHEQTIRAQVPGFLRTVSVTDGGQVTDGDVLCEFENVDLESQYHELQATLAELQSIFSDSLGDDQATAQQTRQQIAQYEFELQQVDQQRRQLRVVASDSGPISLESPLHHRGQFVRTGEPLAVISSGHWIVQMLLDEEHLLGRSVTVGAPVRVRVTGWPHRIFEGHISRVSPHRATDEDLQRMANPIYRDDETGRARHNDHVVYEVQVTLNHPADDAEFIRRGMTAMVRLAAPQESLGVVVLRRVHQFWNRLAVAQ